MFSKTIKNSAGILISGEFSRIERPAGLLTSRDFGNITVDQMSLPAAIREAFIAGKLRNLCYAQGEDISSLTIKLVGVKDV